MNKQTDYELKHSRDRPTKVLMWAAIGALIVALGLVLSGFVSVWAQEIMTPPAPGETPAPMVIESDDVGNVTIRGTVTAVNEGSITIDSWGGEWTISTGADTGVAASANGATGAGDLSGITAGDFIGAEGTFATDQDMTIAATFVRNWTTDPIEGAFDDLPFVGVDAALDTTSGGNAAITEDLTGDTVTYSGTVDSVSETSFTFIDDFDSTYTVHVDAEVGVVGNDGTIMSFGDIEEGDQVELDGVASGDVIDTAMVRITSE